MRITKDSSTLIDVILTNEPYNMINADSIISSLSDHVIKRVNNIKLYPRTIKSKDYKKVMTKLL